MVVERREFLLVLKKSYSTWKLGGIIILPAGTCRTIFSPSNSQRSHLDWLISRAQGSNSINKVLTYGFQADSFTRIGLSHWLSCSFLCQIPHPTDSMKHDDFRTHEMCFKNSRHTMLLYGTSSHQSHAMPNLHPGGRNFFMQLCSRLRTKQFTEYIY